MAKQRKEKTIKDIKLRQPDRSGPTEATLFELAAERELFAKAEAREKELRKRKAGKSEDSDDEEEEEDEEEGGATLSPGMERFLEAMLYTSTLATLHFTFDVFVMNQYGTRIMWDRITKNAFRAWVVFFILFYPLHPHEANPKLLPFLPLRYQKPLRQTIFFIMSCVSGCSLIYVTNAQGYMDNMKRAPPLGCLWLWAVVELDLLWAVPSLVVCAAYLWLNGYSIK